MCRSVRVQLSPSERQDARRLTGIMIPVYASVVLLLLAGVVATSVMRSSGTVVASTGPAAATGQAAR